MPSALGKRPRVSRMTPRFPGMRVLILAVTFAVALFARAAADSSSVGCGFSHTCAVLSTGVVRCWGDNQYGQLGDGLSASNSSLPVTVSGISTASSVASGYYHSCSVLADGSVRCWGRNHEGQLGEGVDDSASPVTVPGITTATDVALGEAHSCALLADASVRCWGSDEKGQIGAGRNGVTSIVLAGASALAAGGKQTCAVLVADASVSCWGDFEVMIDGVYSSDTPYVVWAGPATGVAVGNRHVLVTKPDGTARSWGNVNGQVWGPNNDGSEVSVPGGAIASAGLGWEFSCALTAIGEARCWGMNREGQRGDGTVVSSGYVPDFASFGVLHLDSAAVGLGIATSVSAGGAHACAEINDGSVYCWGDNAYGQLGDATTNDASVPLEVMWLLTPAPPPPAPPPPSPSPPPAGVAADEEEENASEEEENANEEEENVEDDEEDTDALVRDDESAAPSRPSSAFGANLAVAGFAFALCSRNPRGV